MGSFGKKKAMVLDHLLTTSCGDRCEADEEIFAEGDELAMDSEEANEGQFRLVDLPRVIDTRGNLTAGEFGKSVPFDVKRYFMVYQVPLVEVRGEHAHRKCHQFLICARGKISVIADDGKRREEFVLDRPDLGVHLPPMVWGVQHKYSPDAVLLVFASEYYDADDYIRDYDEFLALAGATK